MLHEVRRRADKFDVLHFHVDLLHFPFFEDITGRTVTTLHGRLDLSDLPSAYWRWPQLPLISISNSQRRPLRFARWLGTVQGGEQAAMQCAGLVGTVTAPLLYASFGGGLWAVAGGVALSGLALAAPTLRRAWREVERTGAGAVGLAEWSGTDFLTIVEDCQGVYRARACRTAITQAARLRLPCSARHE